MTSFHSVSPEQIPGNVFDMIGKRWMLITAGDKTKFNTMTASWGGLGVLWGAPSAFSFVRPQRYTLGFLDSQPYYTLSFYDESCRRALNICGSKSGRDCDKVREAGLTPVFGENSVYFEQASLVLVCRKRYRGTFDPKNFITPDIGKNYPDKDYHIVFIGEIVKVLAR